jgi:myo-inositol 2-dehydrogenase/D-chiro-inositol 1-dehydrogenase
MVLCEKPLGRTAIEAEAMVAAVESAGVPNSVWYNYRRVPAVTMIKQLIDEGKLGRIFHYRAKFLQDWTISADLPQGGEGLWRLDVSVAGSGVTGDLLAHNIDTALWLNGPIAEVTAMTETFIKERRHTSPARSRRSASTMRARSCAGSRTDRWRRSKPRDTRADTRRSTRWRSTASTHPRSGTCTISIGSSIDHADEGACGWRNIHVTDGDQPT